MLTVRTKEVELFDDERNRFVSFEAQTFSLEHSLVSLSKWESKWEIPFLTDKPKTTEQTLDYIRCMAVEEVPDPAVFNHLDDESTKKVQEYINAKMTATWFSGQSKKKSPRKEVITSELLYYWMISLNIPFECQHWHLNRLITLIEVCNRKNEKPKKMSKQELASRNRSLNEARKAKLGTSG